MAVSTIFFNRFNLSDVMVHLYLFSTQLLDLFITSDEFSKMVLFLGDDGALATIGETIIVFDNFSKDSGIIWHDLTVRMTFVATGFGSLGNF